MNPNDLIEFILCEFVHYFSVPRAQIDQTIRNENISPNESSSIPNPVNAVDHGHNQNTPLIGNSSIHSQHTQPNQYWNNCEPNIYANYNHHNPYFYGPPFGQSYMQS